MTAPRSLRERMREAGILPADEKPIPPADAARFAVVGNGYGYGQAALARELDELRRAPEGTRNTQLNNAAFSLGQLVDLAQLDRQDVVTALTHTALTIGLGEKETRDTIESGFKGAREKPRDPTTITNHTPIGDTTTFTPDHAGDVAVTKTLPNLPDDFWTRRPALAHIRQAAHSKCRSADALLHVVLARVASLVHHDTGIDTGLGTASLNLITVVVGPSGGGKSSVIAAARDLVMPPWSIDGADGYRDGVPVGTGEGIAELFMGTRQVETGELDRKGDPRVEKKRCQVRHNASVFVDEGEQMLRMGERSGSTIMTTLRSAWGGEVLGQSNASEERTRIIPHRSYALGIVIGLQPSKAQPLFGDAAGGTPQRFLFATTTDPNIPDERPDWPGPLEGLGHLGRPHELYLDVPSIRAQLYSDERAINRGDLVRDEMDSHKPLQLAKVAGLLAILDDRVRVNADDWDLANIVWDTSCAVRDGVATVLSAADEAERTERARRDASRQVMASLAKADALEERAAARDDKILSSAARSIARKVTKEGTATLRTLTHSVAGKHRKAWGPGLVVAAAEYAATHEWIIETSDGYRPGPVEPQP